MADRDEVRVRELLIRGTRYVLGVTVPITVTFVVLAQPILIVRVGERFSDAATAMAVFVSYWLLAARPGSQRRCSPQPGRVRALAYYSWGVALLNLALSLILTPKLGLDGVVLATTIAYFAFAPMLFWLTFTTLPVSAREFARRACAPAYSIGAALAVALLALRSLLDLESVAALLAVGGGGVVLCWAAFYALWTDSDERRFLSGLARPSQTPIPSARFSADAYRPSPSLSALGPEATNRRAVAG